ncbi:MAG TPA: glucan biosynthesis protein [Candidatus Methylacidiphilales bacterium]|jgi:glucans biosynthesis protein|nr:glucan biosynthesis protein [Candidatus Methylacidiphilales bacterium]
MRLHLTLALITIVALVLTLRAEHRHHFTYAQVEKMAAARAAQPYVGLPDALALAPQLRTLTPEEDAGIFSKETARLWRRKGLPFQIDFYHQLNSNPIPHISPRFRVVDAKGPHDPLPYSPSLFNFYNVRTNPPQTLVFNPPLPNNLGFAGFYVRYPDMAIGSNPGSLDGFFSALGASYFRAIAKDQVYGLSGRGIAINTSLDDPKVPEEFPVFTDWWLREPASTATQLVLDAIVDGPSVTGAYEFTITPGKVTSVDIKASLYFRKDVIRLGIDPFSSMYLFGENASDHFNDTAHQEIHDSDGLLIESGKEEWNWQPLSQSDDKRTGAKGYQVQTYTFAEDKPKGFGLLQRDRDYQHYQDNVMLYNVRPSAWVTPHEGFDKGEVTLIERPSSDFNTDNVVMFWHPAEPIKTGDHKEFTYTIDFFMDDSSRPPLAYTRQTLVNVPAPPPPPPAPFTATPTSTATPPSASAPPPPAKTNAAPVVASKPATNAPPASAPVVIGPPYPGKPIPTGTTSVQFLVDFAGNGIENIPANQPPELDLTYDPPGTYVRDQSVEKNGYDNSWRATISIIPFKPFVNTVLKCRLMRNGKPLSETWNYTWRQGPLPGAK